MTSTPTKKPPPCHPLDPDDFVRAWNMANEMPDTPLPAGNDAFSVLTSPLMRQMAALKTVFPKDEDLSCGLLRMVSLADLAKKGHLGPFYHREYGIWQKAVEVLAVAKLTPEGFDLDDVKERLAQIEPPPT